MRYVKGDIRVRYKEGNVTNLPLAMKILTTGVVLAAALFVILSSRYSLAEKNWGYTSVGILAGRTFRRSPRRGPKKPARRSARKGSGK